MITGNFFERVTADASFSQEECSKLILDNVQDAFALVDPQLSVVYYNEAAKEMIRRFLHLDFHLGMNLLQLSQEHRKPVVAKICAGVLRGERHKTEVSFNLPGGQEIFFENSFLPAVNTGGKITGIIITSKNITEKKKAQKIIEESEERMQFALEAAKQGVWDWNLETNEVVFSSSYKKLYGFADDELSNDVSEWISRIHPEDFKKMQESVKEHINAEDPVYDSQYRIKGKDEQYRWIMARGRLLNKGKDGKSQRMIGTHTDITEAVEREAELKLMNDRFDCMLKATHELLWEWDLVNNKIYRFKKSIKKVYGVKDDAGLQTIDEWLQRVHPEDQPAINLALNELLKAAHQHTFELEYRFRKDNGEYAHIYDRGILLKDDTGKPIRVIGSARDISERKRLEKELLQNELSYQRLIHQATVDSQEKERAEIGKELHDNINQVLTTTKLYLDLAQANAEMRIDLIHKSVKNINGVIQEIRQLSRSLMDPSLGDLGLAESINDLIENIHLTRKLNVSLNAEGCIDTVLNDNQKLTVFRIIQEALNNVLRHAKATKAEIYINIEHDQFQLTIKDNGVGFLPELSKKGAGLKNIQNRIYLVNGSLQIKSEPGNGCTIYLQFPI